MNISVRVLCAGALRRCSVQVLWSALCYISPSGSAEVFRTRRSQCNGPFSTQVPPPVVTTPIPAGFRRQNVKKSGAFAHKPCQHTPASVLASLLAQVRWCEFARVCSCKCVRARSCEFARANVNVQACLRKCGLPARVFSCEFVRSCVRLQVYVCKWAGGVCLHPTHISKGHLKIWKKTQRLQPTVRAVKPISQARAIDQVAMRSELRQLDAKLSRRGQPFFFSADVEALRRFQEVFLEEWPLLAMFIPCTC